MFIKLLRRIIMVFLIAIAASVLIYGEENSSEYLSLYNFNKDNINGKYEWKDFTDQVMGGKSEGSSILLQENGDFFLRLSGNVSLENNGGFLQSRLLLSSGLSMFNASDYDGVRLHVRGIDTGYYLFFRTSGTLFPWLYYSAAIDLNEEWQTIDIPWTAVKKGDFGRPRRFNQAKLKSIALVAYGREFTAEVDLKSIGLYRKNK